MKRILIAATLIAASVGAANAQDATAGATVFKKCNACHAVGPDAKNKVGPELNGLDGRHAGSVANFNYSDAVKNSGITWNEQTFLEFINSPKGKIPGTKMAFPGIKEEADVKNLWAYLKQEGKAK